MMLMPVPTVSLDQKPHVVPHFNNLDLTKATLASHEQKRHVGAHFKHLKQTNKQNDSIDNGISVM